MMSRSSKTGALESFQDRCERYLESSGAEVGYKYAFPGWEAKVDTDLLAKAEASYRELFGDNPKREAIHAGLECGVLGDRIPGLEMIAFGPDIFDAHTPNESLVIDTVEPFLALRGSLGRESSLSSSGPGGGVCYGRATGG